MIRKPDGYEQAPVSGITDFESVTPGGHICQIRAAKEEERNGTRQLVIAFDLAADDAQAGYYGNLYAQRLQGNVDAKWPGVYRQSIDGKGTAFFKGLVTVIERSNPGYTWAWDESTLKGKLFGGVFRREQYVGTDGKPHWISRICSVRSVDCVLDVEAPADKPLDNTHAQPVYAPATASAQPTDLPF